MSSLPLRVLVRGSSIATQVAHWGDTRADMAYPRVIEDALLRQQIAVEVRNRAVIAERVAAAVRDWEVEVIGWSPDVVVFHYGYAEAIHLFIPRWIERHANTFEWRATSLNRLYRRVFLRPVWKLLARTQMRIDAIMPAGATSRHLRIARDLDTMVSRVRQVTPGVLVIVPELPSPGERWQRWFPGMTSRVVRANEAIRTRLEGRADDVRWVPTLDLVEQVREAGREPIPDGGHFSAEVHRLLGERIADQIAKWSKDQPHLRP